MRTSHRFLLIVAFLFPLWPGSQTFAQEEGESQVELCGGCHDEAEAFASSRHGMAMARGGVDLDTVCTSCHGPADQHLEEFSAETIRRIPTSESCASCHADAAGAMRQMIPAHARRDVACLDCHNPSHLEGAEATVAPLLQAEPSALCGECHQEQRALGHQAFAHREGGEAFGCESCHAVHGGGAIGRFTQMQNGGVCVSCHSDKAGPFIFPHAPREVDGCVSCHTPHGSSNPRLLVRPTVSLLCLECHSDVPSRSFHDITQARYRACQTCHRAIHGSNSNSQFFEE